MAYAYVATSHKASAIEASIVASFTGSNDKNLILARGSSIEIHTSTPEGLIPISTVPLFGRIACLKSFRPSGCNLDHLFILTTKLHFVSLSWDEVKKQPVPKSTGNLIDKVNGHPSGNHKVCVDSEHGVIGVLTGRSSFQIICEDCSGMSDCDEVKLDGTLPFDIEFLHGCSSPTFAILFEDSRKTRRIRGSSFEIRDSSVARTTKIWSSDKICKNAKFLIAVPAPLGGVIVVGNPMISYFQNGVCVQSLIVESICNNICAYSPIDLDGSRYLLGDDCGRLYVLVLGSNNMTVNRLGIDFLGVSNIPQSINYIDDGLVFVGSRYGDSQLLKLNTELNEDGSYFTVLDNYSNIGPIVDMEMVSGGSISQSHIVTCSGGFGNGSLRIVKSGIRIHDQASMEVDGLKNVWSLKGHNDSYDKYIVQSYVTETRILMIENDEIGEVEDFGDFLCSNVTLYCGHMDGDIILQVCPMSIRLLRRDSFKMVSEVLVDDEVILTAANSRQLAISQNGGKLTLYELDSTMSKLILTSSVVLDYDVACMSLRPISLVSTEEMIVEDVEEEVSVEQKKESPRATILVVGMWSDRSLRVLALPNLQELSRVFLTGDIQARDVLPIKLGTINYLLVGIGDGSLVSFHLELKSEDGLPTLTNRRRIVLGSRPVTFSCFLNSENQFVFANSDRPTLIYSSNNKLLFTAVNIDETLSVSYFNCEMFPEALCIASSHSWMIGSIDSIQKIHCETVAVDGSPRRIAFHKESDTFAVCLERNSATDREGRTSVVFFESSNMNQFESYELDSFEQAFSCSSLVLDISGKSREFVVVGTSYMTSDDSEPDKGRILLFTIDSQGRSVHMAAQIPVHGSVFSLAALQGHFAAAINQKVVVFQCKLEGADEIVISRVTLHSGNIVALFLKSQDDILLVGDIMKSMSLLQYYKENSKLVEISRDYSLSYLRGIEMLGNNKDLFLGADDGGNLYTLVYKNADHAEEERAKLTTFGEFHLGDYINVFRSGSLTNQGSDIDLLTCGDGDNSGLINPVTGMPITNSSFVFGTISGAIGTLLLLSESKYKFFQALESSIETVIKSNGGLSQSKWRSFQVPNRTSPHKNFVDGDFIEYFMDFPIETQQTIVTQLNDSMILLPSSSSTSTNVPEFSTTTSLLGILDYEEKVVTLDDVLVAIEEISRLH